MNQAEVLGRLRALADLERPVWLAGGVAVDFLVGRWTRDHGDIDLVTFEEHRDGLAAELVDRGFRQTDDRGWITNWTNDGRDPGEVSLAFLRRLDDDTGALVLLPSHRGVNPGIYPGVPGSLALDRFRTLEDVRFRVSSPEEEWAYADGFRIMRPGAPERPSVRVNQALLEPLLDDVDRLRGWYARQRRPLDSA